MNRLLLATLLLAALGAPLAADARGPSTPAERKRAVEVTRRLEREPLASGTEAQRRWLLRWIVEIPDIHVQGCSGPLDVLVQDESGEKHGKLLYAQAMFGMAAFLVEHPKQKGDWLAVQTAGVESALRAYRAIVRVDPQARWEELDVLLLAARQGQLQAILEETMEGCGDEQAPAPGDAI